MDTKQTALLHRLRLMVRHSQLNGHSIKSLAAELGVSKDTLSRLLDLLEAEGLVTKQRRSGLAATGKLTYQGALPLDLGLLTTEPLRNSRQHSDFYGERCFTAERILHSGRQHSAFEQLTFTPDLMVLPEHLPLLNGCTIEPLLNTLGLGLIRTHFRAGLAPAPPTMRHLMDITAPAVIYQRLEHFPLEQQRETPLWITERWWHPEWQFSTEFVS